MVLRFGFTPRLYALALKSRLWMVMSNNGALGEPLEIIKLSNYQIIKLSKSHKRHTER
ncbi:unnamed protein product [Acidithrix sp. C25]|nr:unnamed protein product [Acidithrix sp. C25]